MRVRVVVLVLGLGGCGGRAAPGGEPPSASTNAQEDDAGNPRDAQDFPVCPSDPPQVGWACTKPPTEGCAYSVRQSSMWTCTAFVCDATGHWKNAPQGCP